MSSEEILRRKETILLTEERINKNIVIGAPHHAPGGIKNLPCKEHKDSDENAGIIAHRVAEKIKASSVIACNYHIDANKSLGTDYSLQITKWEPSYLIEIHGHSGKRTKPNNAIEISAGSQERNDLSLKFAIKLKEKFEKSRALYSVPVNGNFQEIYFQAKHTPTITSGRWKALHIELPLYIRKEEKDLPEIANEFINLLSETITEICI